MEEVDEYEKARKDKQDDLYPSRVGPDVPSSSDCDTQVRKRRWKWVVTSREYKTFDLGRVGRRRKNGSLDRIDLPRNVPSGPTPNLSCIGENVGQEEKA